MSDPQTDPRPVQPLPTKLWLYTNFDCNLRCTYCVVESTLTATVIATHLEVLDHCLSTRAQLRAAARAAGISDERLRIPADGERIEIGWGAYQRRGECWGGETGNGWSWESGRWAC